MKNRTYILHHGVLIFALKYSLLFGQDNSDKYIDTLNFTEMIKIMFSVK